jgi:hypothetical protein
MRISEYHASVLAVRYPRHLKCVRKGAFYILLSEEAFFLSEKFSFRLTPLDRSTVRVGFPANSLEKWKRAFFDAGWAFVLSRGDECEEFPGTYPLAGNPVDAEAYSLVRARILRLGSVGLEDRETKKFLLKERAEELFLITNGFLMKIPKKERYFLREKIERSMIGILDSIYRYSYLVSERPRLAESVFAEILVFREFVRLVRHMGHLGKDAVYLDVSERCVEMLKIAKALKGEGKD